MDYLKVLRDDPDLAEEFDSLFDFFLLDELSPRDEADGRATFTLPGPVGRWLHRLLQQRR